MRKNTLNYDSIQDEHLDEMIRLAYKYADGLETEEILKNDVHDLSREEEEACKNAYLSFQQKVEKLKQEEKKQSNISQWKKRASRLVGIAACLVLLLGVATPIAIARVESIRVKVLQLLINVQDKYTELKLVEDPGATFDVPADWRGDYYFSYIPEGYALYEIDPLIDRAYYRNIDGDAFSFSEFSQDQEISLDSEGAVISYEFISGNLALVIEKYGTTVTWSDGTKYFIVRSTQGKTDTLKIANSFRRIF